MFSGYIPIPDQDHKLLLSESDSYHDVKIISKYLCMCNAPGLDFFSCRMQKYLEGNLFICISSYKYGFVYIVIVPCITLSCVCVSVTMLAARLFVI